MSFYFQNPTPDKITDFIYLGEAQHADNRKGLIDLSIGGVLDLSGAPTKHEHPIEYMYIEISDHHKANIQQYFEKCHDFIDLIISKNKIVLVHWFEMIFSNFLAWLEFLEVLLL